MINGFTTWLSLWIASLLEIVDAIRHPEYTDE